VFAFLPSPKVPVCSPASHSVLFFICPPPLPFASPRQDQFLRSISPAGMGFFSFFLLFFFVSSHPHPPRPLSFFLPIDLFGLSLPSPYLFFSHWDPVTNPSGIFVPSFFSPPLPPRPPFFSPSPAGPACKLNPACFFPLFFFGLRGGPFFIFFGFKCCSFFGSSSFGPFREFFAPAVLTLFLPSGLLPSFHPAVHPSGGFLFSSAQSVFPASFAPPYPGERMPSDPVDSGPRPQ